MFICFLVGNLTTPHVLSQLFKTGVPKSVVSQEFCARVFVGGVLIRALETVVG